MNLKEPDLCKPPKELLEWFEQDLIWYHYRDFSNLTKEDAGIFLEALHSKNDNVKAGAMLVLGYLQEFRAIPFLLAALKSKHFGLKISAISALGDLRFKKVVVSLLEMLDNHIYDKRSGKDRETSYAIVHSLGKIGDVRATSRVVDLLQNASDEVLRIYAAGALGEIKDPSAFEPLIQALGDESSEVDTSVAKALVNYKNEKAIPALIKAFGNHYNRVVNDPHAVNELGVVVAQLGEVVVEPLIQALKSEKQRWLAAKALGRIGDTRAIAPLYALYEDKTVDHDTLEYVTRALRLLTHQEVPFPW